MGSVEYVEEAREQEDAQVRPGDRIPGRSAKDESELEWCLQ